MMNNILEIKRNLYKKSYYHFFKDAYKILLPSDNFTDNWHIKELCNILQNETERIINREQKTQDYIINIPPRTSKSLICSIIYPVWCWIKDPSLVLMTISYSDEVATDNSYQSKLLLKSKWFQDLFGHEFKINYDSDAKSDYINDKSGRRMALGITGSITSKGAHIIIIDDPQNPKKADSDVERMNVINLYTKTVYNRYKDPNTIVRFIIQQRLHEEDLSGYLIKKNVGKYLHINLPAIKDNNISPKHFIEKYNGEFLDPVRLSLKILKDNQEELGSRGYSSQYLQNPVPSDGELVKRSYIDIISLRDFNQMLNNAIVYGKYNVILTEPTINWDFFLDTAEGVETGDSHAILCATTYQNIMYVKYVDTSRDEIPDFIRRLQRVVETYGNSNSKIYVEPKSSGRTIVQTLKRESNLNIILNEAPRESKIARLKAVQPKLEAKRVVLIEGNWNDDFITELIGFPNMKHDDQVDVLEMAVRKLLVHKFENNFMF